ncbi:alpha-protein kinase 2 isoform X2 [Pteropus medius]|uniref:alpha-protein kinase 2 isoform X2 n=1 Tax=Pteropus vampyrus TaxID=132908 RepID=UPI00196AD41D|nr:alpha-protein kinase 2 isoform X2 [Pteropus giganteus]
MHRLLWPRCSPAPASIIPLPCPAPKRAPRDPAPAPPGSSPQPQAPPTPRNVGQPPPTPTLGRSVQALAEPPQQRLRKTIEGRAARSGEQWPRGRGRRRLRGQGRQGLQRIPAQRDVPRRRPSHCRCSRQPHRGPRLQRTFRSPPCSSWHRGGRGGRTNREALHRTRRRKLYSPPRRDRLTWHERMTDSGGPQKRTLCFLSSLLSQKVPEKSDAVLRCIIVGQPKPEVTWYKNGQTIEDCDIISSYEFFENQYIHVLHLCCCTKNDAAVYQISAKNCFGMICCSASIEVECSSENPQFSPNPKDGGDTGWEHETQTYEQKSTNQADEKEHPYKEEENPSLATPKPTDFSSSQFNPLCSLPLLASNDICASGSENPLGFKGTRQTEEACDPNNTKEIADGLLFPNASNIPDKQDECCHGMMQSKVSKLTDGALNDDGLNDEDLSPSHRNPKVQKYISISLPLPEAATSIYPGDRATVNKQVSPQVSSEDSDSDYELCPEITLTYMEEFSDDDLEYLECSDVMTDYSNAVWQRDLQGTEHVFLLESDDEVMEFGECGLGVCEPFLSEMGSRPGVSDNTGPMEATTGFCGYHSQPQEVRVRRHRASTHSPSSPQTGMTLTLGPHQDGTSTVTDQGRYKLPTASAENDYPGIQGETRDSHRAGEEFASDNLLDMDKAVAEREVKRLSGELEKLEMDQCLETTAKERVEETHLWSERGSETPAGARRPGIKGKPEKLNPNLNDSATEGTLKLLHPEEPVKHPLTHGDKEDSSHAKAEAADLNFHFHAGDSALPTRAEEANTLQTPPGTLPKEGNLNLEEEGVQVNNLLETSRVPDQSDHPQVQIQETARAGISLSQMPASSEPAGEESAFTGTTTNSSPNLGGMDEENASLVQHLGIESSTQGPQSEAKQDREDKAPGHSREDLGHELSLPEADRAILSPCELSVHAPQEGSADPREPQARSVASPAPANIVPTLETMCHKPRDREAECAMEHLEAGDPSTRDTMDSAVGMPEDKYLPQETCSMDLELAEGQSEVSEFRSLDDKTLDVLCRTRGSEPPQSTCRSNEDGDMVVSPPPVSSFAWNIPQKASEGASEEGLAKVENATSTLASVGQASQARPSPSPSGGLEERQPPSSEDSSVQRKEGGAESPSTGASDTTGASASQSLTVELPQEKPTTFTANLDCLQVTRESGDTPTVSIATRVHPAKYVPVSIAGNRHADGPEQSLLQAQDENIFPLPSDVHILNDSTTESPKERLCLAPRGPGARVRVPGLPAGGGVCSDPPLHADDQSEEKSQAVDRADTRRLEENFQEKGSETARGVRQESPPSQHSVSEDKFQESRPTTSVAEGDINLVPLDHSSANSREERGQSSGLGTSVSAVATATVDNDSQAVSNAPPLSNTLPEVSKESGPGQWGAGNKLKIITLEASVLEVWPPRPPTESACEASEAGAMTPDGVWAVSDVLKAGATVPEPDPSEIASARSPEAESGSALVNDREIREGEEPASHAHQSSLSFQCLSQPRLLESSVDPVDEKELCVTDLPSEASKTGGQENVNSVSPNQEESQLSVGHPAFFKRFLTGPQILESSVDPIDETGVVTWKVEAWELPESSLRLLREESKPNNANLGQRVEVGPASVPAPCPDEGTEPSPSGGSRSQERHESRSGEAEQSENLSADFVFPTLPLSNCLAIMTHASVGVHTHAAGQSHDTRGNELAQPGNHPCAFPDSKGAGERERENHVPAPSGLPQSPFTSCLEGNITNFSISHEIEEPEIEAPQSGDTKPTNASGSLSVTLASVSGERASEGAPKTQQDPCQPGPYLGHRKKSGEDRLSHMATQNGRCPVTSFEEVKKKQETTGSGHLTGGIKKKILSRVAALRLRLEERENVKKNSSFLKKGPKLETSVSRTDEQKDPQTPPCKREGKAPILLKKIQAEMFPDCSGNVKLSCQFGEIHEDSTIWWTKDSKSIAQVQRSAGDSSAVSLVIVQASQKDQGLYHCCIKNSYGKATAELNLTTEGCEEIEFSQLIFKEDFLHDSYFGAHLRGQIATEELHFGEGVHRKAFRSKVMQGLMPVFQPGHACVLKVHNAVAYGTRNNDELIQRNYKLAAQECYVQNTARCYAKIYAAEAQPLEGFGEVPEIIPIFLIHRPENNIPYATVEEELIGEFVKYSIRDGKEINFLRRESEAGQKCCTFQHWVYQKTSGCLLVTDMQGVGMKLTDVGIATLAKGYKGFKGNCSMTFIDQFKALHQCNKYCKMLGLTSLQNNNQKQKKPSVGKKKIQPNSTTGKNTVSGTPTVKKT